MAKGPSGSDEAGMLLSEADRLFGYRPTVSGRLVFSDDAAEALVNAFTSDGKWTRTVGEPEPMVDITLRGCRLGPPQLMHDGRWSIEVDLVDVAPEDGYEIRRTDG